MTIKEDIKEIFTASYDQTTNKIVGCRKNSLAYLHEKEHEKQAKTGYLQLISQWQSYMLLGCILCLTLEQLETARSFLAIFAVLMVGVELQAWYGVLINKKTHVSAETAHPSSCGKKSEED